jgi:hypothetical protein
MANPFNLRSEGPTTPCTRRAKTHARDGRRSAAEGASVSGAQFTVFVILVRVLYRQRPLGDHFGHPPPTDWPGVAVAAVGVVGAVAGGWAVYGPGWLPWWAALAVAFVAGGVVERLADRWGSRAEPFYGLSNLSENNDSAPRD